MNTTLTTKRVNSDGNARLALLVVLASEVIFFATLISAYFFLRQSQASWPLLHVPLSRLILPGGNTLLIAMSVLTAHLGLKAVQKNQIGQLRTWLAVTLLLGLAFVSLQVVEFNRSGMLPDDQAFGGVFFTLMGFHALHVMAGVVLLANNLWRAFLGDFTPRRYTAIQLGTWFWDFIVGVWVILFIALYLV
jgi:cytochrome c oxidase subunit 3